MRKLLTLVLVLAAGAAGVLLERSGRIPGWDPVRAIGQTQPGPGGPPVVWVTGTLEGVTATELSVRQGSDGPVVALRRLAGKATAVFRRDGRGWEALPPSFVPKPGGRVCAETLLDGASLVAFRVFLDARGCGPA